MSANRYLLSLGSTIALIGLVAGPIAAKKLSGVTMADEVAVEGQRLVLNGMGKREATFFRIDVYVAGLYLPQPTSDANAILDADEPKRLQMVFVRDVDRDDITEGWTDGFHKNVDERTLEALRGRIGQFNGWMKKMRERESITLTYLPGTGTIVEIDGRRMGVIEGRDFGRALFSIWLGPHPPNGKLKKGLLGR